MVEAKVRPPAFGAGERCARKDAPKQCEIAHGERAFQLVTSHLVRTSRPFVEPHGRNIFAFNPLVLRKCLPERPLLPDRTKLSVRQHAAVHPNVGLQWAIVAAHQVCKPCAFEFRDVADFRSCQIDTQLLGECCGLSARATAIHQRRR
jgi:hypothetical protein